VDKGLLICCDGVVTVHHGTWPGIRLCACGILTSFHQNGVTLTCEDWGGKIGVNPQPTNNIPHHFPRWLVGAPGWRCGRRFTMPTAMRFAERAEGYRVEFGLPPCAARRVYNLGRTKDPLRESDSLT
jgi:hypothetical protein